MSSSVELDSPSLQGDDIDSDLIEVTPPSAFQAKAQSCYKSLRARPKLFYGLIIGSFALVVTAIIVTAVVLTSNGGINNDGDTSDLWTSDRLSSTVVPNTYWVHLSVDMDKFTFVGNETISLNVLEPTSLIVLHSNALVITDAAVTLNTGKTIRPQAVITDVTRQFLVLQFKENEITKAAHSLSLKFKGDIKTNLAGLYRSSYKMEGSSSTEWLAVTQFEPTDARRMFPCFDEPAFKAIFHMSVEAPYQFTVYSNTQRIHSYMTSSKNQVSYFAPSPIMSTYLVALVVAIFECDSVLTNDGINIRVCSRPLARGGELRRFALDNAVEMMEYYTDYFGISYPLTKAELFAIPDFGAGAMENWGLITFREKYLLLDPRSASASAKQDIAGVIAHELAHQWFGNLVTMKWWDDLWLNEGFASFMELQGQDAVHPEWDMYKSQFYTGMLMNALRADSLASTHPIEATIDDPNDVFHLFDTISYDKGAAVLRMLSLFLSEIRSPRYFQDHLYEYLNKYSYSSATTADLWDSFEDPAQGGLEIERLMDSWTTQEGYPLLTVTRDGRITRISQARFWDDPADASAGSTRWWVPITYLAKNATGVFRNTVLMRGLASFALPEASGIEWYKINAANTAPCRTLYPVDMLQAIRASLMSNISILDASDRAGLLGDSFATMLSGHTKPADAFNYISYASTELAVVPLQTLLSYLRQVGMLVRSIDFDAYSRSLLSNAMSSVGWSGYPAGQPEHHVDLLRGDLLMAGVQFGDADVIAEASTRFEAMRAGSSSVEADIRAAVYAGAVRLNSASVYDWLTAEYKKTSDVLERVRLLAGLASPTSTALLQRTLDFSISSDVRPQDASQFVIAVSSNRFGSELAWAFLQAKWDTLMGTFSSSSLVEKVIANLPPTQGNVDQVKAYFEAHPQPNLSDAIKEGLSALTSNVRRQQNGMVEAILNATSA